MTDDARLLDHISQRVVSPGRIACWWLGGSGFVFKTPEDKQIYVDPYLSDAAKAIFGQERAEASPIDPEEARPDIVVCTHWHEDHLDPVAIPAIASNSPSTRFVMPPSAMARALSWGVPRESIVTLSPGGSIEVQRVRVRHVPARHESGLPGWETPDAMGVILETAGLSIYHSGDTEYDVRLRELRSYGPDVVIACINGTGGNMDAHEAALLARQLKPKLAIPMHFGLWRSHPDDDHATLDPDAFARTYRALGGGEVAIPQVGQEIMLGGWVR